VKRPLGYARVVEVVAVVVVTDVVEVVEVEVVVVSHSESSGPRQPPGESGQHWLYCGNTLLWLCWVNVQRALMARHWESRQPRSQMRRAVRFPSQFRLQRS
jgi:hypothetical protein